jgi:hypothetical protein
MKRWLKIGGGILVTMPLLVAAALSGSLFFGIMILEDGMSLYQRMARAWPPGAVMVGAIGAGLLLWRYLVLARDTDVRQAENTIRTQKAAVGRDGRWTLLVVGIGVLLTTGAIVAGAVEGEIGALLDTRTARIAVALVGVGIGGALVGVSGYRFLLRHWYGDTVLELDALPGRLGARLEGQVHTGVPAGTRPEGGFEVVLRCRANNASPHEVAARRRQMMGDRYEDDAAYEEGVVWRRKDQVPAQPSVDGRTLVVPLSIDLPDDGPPSPPTNQRNWVRWALTLLAALAGRSETPDQPIRWTLTVKADLPGIDYRAAFEVPVQAPDPAVEEEAAKVDDGAA